MKRFYVAALTGRSGTGKSYAANYLRKKGVAVIDGDVVAREVTQPGERGLRAYVKVFGRDILRDDGTLDRRKLGDIAFADPKKKKLLDEAIHPIIIDRLLDYFEEMKEDGVPFCVVEAGALIESGLYAACDKIILITANEETAIARITARDGITRAQAETRLSAQIREEEVRELSDVIITNDGTLKAFERKLDILADQLNRWFLPE